MERQPGRPGDVSSPRDLLPAGTRLSFPPRDVQPMVAVGIFLLQHGGLAPTPLCTTAGASSGSECATATCWQQEPEIHLINVRRCCFPSSWGTWQPPDRLEVHQIPQGREAEIPALPHRLQGSRGEDSEPLSSPTPADTLGRVRAHGRAMLAAELLGAEGLHIPPLCTPRPGD